MPKKHNPRILILEDEQTLSRSLRDALERAGYTIEIEIDGVKGLKKIETSKPDLVLLDLILPGLSGLDVLKALVAKPSLKSIPVIVLSNLDDPKSVIEAKRLGAKAYLIKAQVTLEEIIKKIEQTLA